MVRSMTTFARVSHQARNAKWSVEIRSLNHRYFEFSLKAPQSVYAIEGKIKNLVQEKLKRGKVTVSISQEYGDDNAKALAVDDGAVKFYLNALNGLKKKYHLKDEVSVDHLLHLPKIFTVDKSFEDEEKNWPVLQRVLNKVLKDAIRGKEVEGGKHALDITKRLRQIMVSLGKIEKHAAKNFDRYWTRITERLEKLLGEKEMDQDRVYREAALMAEKSDITEEVVRLKSHVERFTARMNGGEEIGRELDFFCQEMHREINTLGAKSQYFEISKEVVFIKKELEKVREQVQNIE